MTQTFVEEKRLHDCIGFARMGSQATSVAVLQLCTKLRLAGVLNDGAITRIKEAVAKDIAISQRGCSFQDEVKTSLNHLDKLFSCIERTS